MARLRKTGRHLLPGRIDARAITPPPNRVEPAPSVKEPAHRSGTIRWAGNQVRPRFTSVSHPASLPNMEWGSSAAGPASPPSRSMESGKAAHHNPSPRWRAPQGGETALTSLVNQRFSAVKPLRCPVSPVVSPACPTDLVNQRHGFPSRPPRSNGSKKSCFHRTKSLLRNFQRSPSRLARRVHSFLSVPKEPR